MKAVFFLGTMVVQFLLMWGASRVRMSNAPVVVVAIVLFCIIMGITMRVSSKSTPVQKKLGWGLLWGSATTVALVAAFLIWFVNNFNR